MNFAEHVFSEIIETKQYYYKGICGIRKTVPEKVVTTQQYGNSSSAPVITHTTTFGYTDEGRLSWEQTVYYDALGREVCKIEEGYHYQTVYNDNSLIYRVVARNRFNAPIRCEFGNGVSTDYTYNENGLLTRINTGKKGYYSIDTAIHGGNSKDGGIFDPNYLGYLVDSTILNYRYTYDTKGLMTIRSESVVNRKETYTYDNLDRLTKITPNVGVVQTINYSGNGNIEKYGTGIYTYGIPKPHAVTQVANNSTPFNASTVTYNYFNQPTKIKEGNNEISLFYGSNQQRNKAEFLYDDQNSTHYYINKYFEKEDVYFRPQFSREYRYIYGDNGVVALKVYDGRKYSDSLYYIHTDHLGSYCAITNENKQIVKRNRFDPWGNTIVSDIVTYFPLFTITDRGFTGHEHYPEFNIINMNGRLYDPVIARFFSPDKYVANSSFTQDFNRYTYARNNPLMYTDPSGEFIIGLLISALSYTITTAAINGGFQNWNWFHFTFSAFVGLATSGIASGVGGAVITALTSAGVGGFAGGLIGGVTGGIVSGTINGLMQNSVTGATGKDFWKGLGINIGMSAGMQGLRAGLQGGFLALKYGERFWLGGTKREFGSSQPISPSEQAAKECQLESMRAISNSNCDNYSESDLRDCMVKNESGYTLDFDTWKKYGKLTGYQIEQDNVLTQTEFTKRFMAGDRISINLYQGDDIPGHTVTAADIYGKEIIRVNGTVRYKIDCVRVMNPANFSNGGYNNLQWNQIRSSEINKFFIRF